MQAMIREYSLIIRSRRSDILLKDIQNSFRCCFTKLERIRSKLTLYFFFSLISFRVEIDVLTVLGR